MHDHKPASPLPATLLAAFFAIVTSYVLFADVAHGAPVTTAHALSLAALVAAIASGHYAWPQLRSGNLVTGAMLSILFVAATAYVVVTSGARNGETAQAKIDRASEIHAARARELEPMARAQAMLDTARAKLPADCKGGEGRDCKGTKATIAVYEAAIKGHKAALAELGAPVTVTGYTHAARVLAAIPGITATQDAIEARLELVVPFLAVLISELGTIAFAHLATSASAANWKSSGPTFADSQQTSFAVDCSMFSGEQPNPQGPNPPRKTSRLPENVLAFPAIAGKHPVLAAIEQAGGAVGSNRELANLMGVSEGEASKRWQEVQADLTVTRDGRHRRIELRRA